MKLRELQRRLERIYRIGVHPPVERFLLNADQARVLAAPGLLRPPQVLLVQEKDGLFLGLHFGDEDLRRIERADPRTLSLQDFCALAEEISHFTYLFYRAQNDRPVSLLDLEFQGEIDKFLLASVYFSPGRDLFGRLFDQVSYDRRLNPEERRRYEEANRLGRKFVRALMRLKDALRRLPEFYRLASQARLLRAAAL